MQHFARGSIIVQLHYYILSKVQTALVVYYLETYHFNWPLSRGFFKLKIVYVCTTVLILARSKCVWRKDSVPKSFLIVTQELLRTPRWMTNLPQKPIRNRLVRFLSAFTPRQTDRPVGPFYGGSLPASNNA